MVPASGKTDDDLAPIGRLFTLWKVFPGALAGPSRVCIPASAIAHRSATHADSRRAAAVQATDIDIN